jgi:hypothetical protein
MFRRQHDSNLTPKLEEKKGLHEYRIRVLDSRSLKQLIWIKNNRGKNIPNG